MEWEPPDSAKMTELFKYVDRRFGGSSLCNAMRQMCRLRISVIHYLYPQVIWKCVNSQTHLCDVW